MSGGWRERPPAGGAPRPFTFPAVVRAEIAPGLDAVLAPLPRVPLVSLGLLAAGGGQEDPSGRAGLATLTAAVRDEGTRARDAMALASAIERLGGSLGTAADWDASYLRAAALAPHLPTALALLAEVAREPAFPQAEVERLRRQRLAEILARRAQPGALADERFARAVYGQTPYGWPLVGDEATVGALGRADLVDFHDRHLAPAPWTLLAVGDFAVDDLLARAAAAFGARAVAAPRSRPPAAPPAAAEIQVHVVDRPDAAQTELRVGHVGLPRRHSDHVAATVANTLLGGKFTSRINLNLRERHGYTYGAFSRFVPRRGAGPFVVSAAVTTAATGAAAREVLNELERLRQEPVPAAELAETRSYLVGVFPYTVQTGGDLARRLEDLVVFGLPDDYYAAYLGEISAVGPQAVQEVAQRHLHPEAATVVAVGPAAELRPQLDSLGPVTVVASPTPAWR